MPLCGVKPFFLFFSSHQNTNEDRFSKYGGALGAHGIEKGPGASFSCFNLDSFWLVYHL